MANGEEKKGCDPNLPLRNYLIDLAINDEMRVALNGNDRAKRQAAIEEQTKANKLEPADVKALLDRSFNDVKDLLRCNQQNT